MLAATYKQRILKGGYKKSHLSYKTVPEQSLCTATFE